MRLLYRNLRLLFVIVLVIFSTFSFLNLPGIQRVKGEKAIEPKGYWFLLSRKSNVEYLYFGAYRNKENSELIREFKVKSGVPGEKPTPLPELLGREYWKVVSKMENLENPETAPYFLTLDIPVSEAEPYGPEPYLECNGQCNWILPGSFGLHGVGGDDSRLAADNLGSSGCVRHSDSDITFLYNLLDPSGEEIRYYIQDI